MNIITHFLSPLFKHYSLFHWTDVFEIFFFAAIFYYVSLWLRKDKKKNLLFYFYAYCLATFLAYTFHLETATRFLFLYSPVIAMIFLMLHEDSLQKNFIVARSTAAAKPKQDWLALLFQSLLTVTNRKKQIICAIEKNDSLKTLLDSPLSFHADIEKNLLDILLNSPSFDGTKILLLNHHGQLLALNATWQALVDETWTADIQNLETWKQDAFLLTNKTDALVFSIEPESRTVTIIAQKKFLEAVSIQEAIITIKHYLYGKAHPLSSYEGTYEAHHKRFENQPLP
jgi:hypothetical protein